MFYVYEWYIIDTGEIIYVGKGSKRRYLVRKHNVFFNDMIRRFDCKSRIIKTFDTEREAFEYEFVRVRELKTVGQCVCNIYNGGFGGTVECWTEEMRQRYSDYNVMKSQSQRERMSKDNPMKRHEIAAHTNSQKRIPVIIDGVEYISIADAGQKLSVSTDTIRRWCQKGINPKNQKCSFKDKQSKHNKRYKHGNQQPSRENDNQSISEGSTTNG